MSKLRGRINGQKGGNSILVKHEKLPFQIYFVETFTKMMTFHNFKTLTRDRICDLIFF